MSKKKKSEAKRHRRAAKRARKAAEQAKYEAWKAAGQNTKSRRAKLRARRLRRATVRAGHHATGPCGNIGCKRCNPIAANLVSVRLLHRAA
jgi:hypothetical protein